MHSGRLILGFFAALWLVLGALALPVPRKLKAATAVVVAGTSLLLFFVLRWSSVSFAAPRDVQQVRTAFLIINLIQYLAIACALVVLIRHGRRDLLFVAISAIVGLHFLALAPVFDFPLYYVTGGVMLAVDALAIALRTRIRTAFVCLATGIVLQLTGALL